MGDGAAERSGRRALDVDVDPLVVAGRVGEGVRPGSWSISSQSLVPSSWPFRPASSSRSSRMRIRGSCRGGGLRGSGTWPNLAHAPILGRAATRSARRPRCCCTTTSTAGCARRRCSSSPTRSATSCPRATPTRSAAGSRESADSGSLVRYLETFDHTVAVMQTEAAIERVARECVADLAADGVVYAEVRYAPEQHVERGSRPRPGRRRGPVRLRGRDGRRRRPDRRPPAAHRDAAPGPLARDRRARRGLARRRGRRLRHRRRRGRLPAHPAPRRVRVPPAPELPLHHPRRRGLRAAVDLGGHPVVRRRPARPRGPDRRRHHRRRRRRRPPRPAGGVRARQADPARAVRRPPTSRPARPRRSPSTRSGCSPRCASGSRSTPTTG